MTTKKTYDVAIIGGNLTGATAALALHQIGLKVALVEPNAVQPLASRDLTKLPFALRVSSIIPTVKKFFQRLGVWQDLPKERLQAVKNMQVGESDYFINFDYRQSPYKELAHIIENDVLQSALWQKLTDANIDILHTRMQNIHNQDTGELLIELEDANTISSKLLIGADGANSQVRQKLGILWDSKDYQQHCIVGNVRPSKSHQQTAWQSYHQGNPLAFLPHPDGSCSLAWYVKPSLGKQLLEKNSTTKLQQALNNTVELANLSQLGNIEITQTLQAFPIKRGRARCSHTKQILLIGDACRTIHPMAGQGVNLGVLDVAVLQQELKLAKSKRLDITHPSIIKRCARRRSDDKIVQYGMDFFDSLFKGSTFSKLRINALRVATCPPIKQKLISFATGHYQDIPEYLTRLH